MVAGGGASVIYADTVSFTHVTCEHFNVSSMCQGKYINYMLFRIHLQSLIDILKHIFKICFRLEI